MKINEKFVGNTSTSANAIFFWNFWSFSKLHFNHTLAKQASFNFNFFSSFFHNIKNF